jgi:hypothetical protein
MASMPTIFPLFVTNEIHRIPMKIFFNEIIFSFFKEKKEKDFHYDRGYKTKSRLLKIIVNTTTDSFKSC